MTIPGYTAFGGRVYLPGTSYNRVGTAHVSTTFYRGNGGYIYGRGDPVKVTPIGSGLSNLYYRSSSGAYIPVGETMYYAGSEKTYYQGNGASGYLRGSTIDAIDYDGTLYEKGSSFTAIGSEPDVTLYYRDTDGDRTVAGAGDPCELKLATFTTRNVTALTV